VTANRHWTPDEDKRVLELKTTGKPAVVIAKELKRAEAAIISRIGLLRLK
jgi:hypothetical protein